MLVYRANERAFKWPLAKCLYQIHGARNIVCARLTLPHWCFTFLIRLKNKNKALLLLFENGKLLMRSAQICSKHLKCSKRKSFSREFPICIILIFGWQNKCKRVRTIRTWKSLASYLCFAHYFTPYTIFDSPY